MSLDLLPNDLVVLVLRNLPAASLLDARCSSRRSKMVSSSEAVLRDNAGIERWASKQLRAPKSWLRVSAVLGLGIHTCRIRTWGVEAVFTDDHLLELAANLPSLKELDMGGGWSVTASGLRSLAQRSPRLESIRQCEYSRTFVPPPLFASAHLNLVNLTVSPVAGVALGDWCVVFAACDKLRNVKFIDFAIETHDFAGKLLSGGARMCAYVGMDHGYPTPFTPGFAEATATSQISSCALQSCRQNSGVADMSGFIAMLRNWPLAELRFEHSECGQDPSTSPGFPPH